MSELAVFDDSGSAVPRGGAPRGSKPWRSKKRLFVIVVLVIVILAAPATYFVLKRVNKKPAIVPVKIVNNKVCTTNRVLMQKGIDDIEKKEIPALNGVVDKIKAFPNYDTDQNCLAIIAWSYILKSDSNQAKIYSDKVAAIYKKESDSAIGNIYTSDPVKLNKSIDLIIKNSKVNDTQANYQPKDKL